MLVKDNSNMDVGELRRLLREHCPACKETLNKHSYALVGRTVASDNNSQRLGEFFDALKSYRWQKASTFREFDGAFNSAEAP